MARPTKEPQFQIELVEEGLVRVTVTMPAGSSSSFLLRVVPEWDGSDDDVATQKEEPRVATA